MTLEQILAHLAAIIAEQRNMIVLQANRIAELEAAIPSAFVDVDVES